MRAPVWLMLALAVLIALAGCARRTTVVTAEDPDAAAMEAGAPLAPASTSAVVAPGPTAPPGAMVLLKRGRFMMGSESTFFHEDPAHSVTVPAFRLDVTKVTVAQYRSCVREGVCTAPQGIDAIWDPAGLADVPISGVTWYQARDYCAWAGKELPTEEQWEYACRGPTGREFPWGREVPGQRWGEPLDGFSTRVSSACETCRVGTDPTGATSDGIQDMKGLVKEWTATAYCPYDKPKCASTERATRGGFVCDPQCHRCMMRGVHRPTESDSDIGFRCAQRVEGA